jgi:hypothetical protein
VINSLFGERGCHLKKEVISRKKRKIRLGVYQLYGVEFIFGSRIALGIGQEQGLAARSRITNAL